MRPIQVSDFKESVKRIRRSVPFESIAKYEAWNREYGDITVWSTFHFFSTFHLTILIQLKSGYQLLAGNRVWNCWCTLHIIHISNSSIFSPHQHLINLMGSLLLVYEMPLCVFIWAYISEASMISTQPLCTSYFGTFIFVCDLWWNKAVRWETCVRLIVRQCDFFHEVY